MPVRRVYKFRAYPTKTQAEALDHQLQFCCDLYNAALEQRKTLYRRQGVSVTHKQQSRQLTELRQELPELCPVGLSRSAMQKTLERLDRSFKAFYRRVERREKAGFPRFKSRHRFDTLAAQYGKACRFHASTSRSRRALLYWGGVGELKVRAHRPLPDGARITEVQIKRAAGGTEWYVYLGLEMPASPPLPATGASVGVDVGITTFAALSTGEQIAGPRSYQRHERRLAQLQQELSRCRRGSNRRRRRRAQLARAHARIRRARRDHAHKTAYRLVREFDVIVIEDLNIKGLARGQLAKHVNDQGWGLFARILADKAAEAGRLLVKVDARGSSQECSGCEGLVSKELNERVHRCSACALELDRDVNAARVILRRGERLREALMAAGPQASIGAEREIIPAIRAAA